MRAKGIFFNSGIRLSNGYKFSVLLFIFICCASNVFAQVHLSRVSNTARSDGLGYVVRFHFDAAVDSFTVIQPAPDLIQMVLYGDDIDTTGLILPMQSEKINEVRLYKLNYGYGVDVYLPTDMYFKASAYPDQNQRDILIALTESPKNDVERYAQQFIAKTWYDDLVVEVPPAEGPAPEPAVTEYDVIRDKLRFDRVVINAGHGEWDPGSIGYKGVKEKDITLAVALKTGKYIEELLDGVEVIYTRKDDSYNGLAEIGRIANDSQGDLFISIHTNAYPNKYVSGTEVYFLGLAKSEAAMAVMKRENSVFAHEIEEELTEEDLLVYELAHSGYLAVSEKIAYMIDEEFRTKARRKSRGVKQAPFQVLYEASMPAVLVELGFITNPAEQRFLTSEEGQAYMASAIYRAVKAYKEEYERAQAYNSTN